MFDPKISRISLLLSEITPDLPVGRPNLSEHRSNQDRRLCWAGIFPVTHNFRNSSKKFRSAKGPCPKMNLTWQTSCPNLNPTCISPTDHFVDRPPTPGTKMSQISPNWPQTFMGIIRGPVSTLSSSSLPSNPKVGDSQYDNASLTESGYLLHGIDSRNMNYPVTNPLWFRKKVWKYFGWIRCSLGAISNQKKAQYSRIKLTF